MAKHELIFDEATHTYTMGGVKLPSVTTAMKPLYDFTYVDPDVLRRAGEFGTAVHKTIELFIYDDLDEESLDPSLLGPLEAFKKWQRDYPQFHDLQQICVEKRMAHKKLKFAGTADLILDGMAIVDFKTRPVNLITDAIQLAAYEALWKEEGGSRIKEYERRVLELKQDGTYAYTKVNHKDAWLRFRYLLDYYNATLKIQSWRINK